jgi:hypothetical protein
MNKAHLCKCNNCENILIDQNSQVDATEHELKGNEIEMQYNEKEGIWVCPICETDGYLTDL